MDIGLGRRAAYGWCWKRERSTSRLKSQTSQWRHADMVQNHIHWANPASTPGQLCLQVRRIPEAIHGSALLFVRFPRTLSVCILESILLFTIIELSFSPPRIKSIILCIIISALLLNCARVVTCALCQPRFSLLVSFSTSLLPTTPLPLHLLCH